MPLFGKAALAMWWDMSPAIRTEFEDWHSHEHFPERLGIPGFLRGSRWRAVEGEGFYVMYELEAFETLTSPPYVHRLNNPTPWSTKLFPHHRNMVRSQCRVLETSGSGIAGHMMTIRFSPDEGDAEAVRSALRSAIQRIPHLPGLSGAHLLRTETPQMAATVEQKIRGGRDAAADWIMLVSGYEAGALEDCKSSELADILRDARYDTFRLSLAATPRDLGVGS